MQLRTPKQPLQGGLSSQSPANMGGLFCVPLPKSDLGKELLNGKAQLKGTSLTNVTALCTPLPGPPPPPLGLAGGAARSSSSGPHHSPLSSGDAGM